MALDDWSEGKKIVAILICIIIVISVMGVVAFFITKELAKTAENITSTIIENTNSSENVFSVDQGKYKVKIETDNSWTSYITTDSKYSQNKGSGSKTINLGTINRFSSITINQKGNGFMKVSVIDSEGDVVGESINSFDNGVVSILLNVD